MKKRSNSLNHIIVYQPYNYNGIQVRVGHRKEVMVKPIGASAWLTYDRDELIEQVKNMPSSGSVQGVPRDVMWEYLNFDFDAMFWRQ